MPDPDAGRTLEQIARDFGAARRTFQRRTWGECGRKRRYPALDYALQAQSELPYGEALHVYACGFCHGYHLGRHQEPTPLEQASA